MKPGAIHPDMSAGNWRHDGWCLFAGKLCLHVFLSYWGVLAIVLTISAVTNNSKKSNEHEVAITERGFFEKSVQNESLHYWSVAGKTVNGPFFTIVYCEPRRYFVIPHSAFSDVAQRKDFFAAIKARTKV